MGSEMCIRDRAAVNRVDTAMCKIRDSGKIKARDRIAVLAALNLAFDANANASTSTSEGDSNPEMADPVELTLNRRQSDVLLEPLLRRLDKVLGDDGKLF